MSSRSFPWVGFALALAACTVLVSIGTDFYFVLAVLLVWAGSLWLVGSSPPQSLTRQRGAPPLRESMGDLIEHSELPVLVTETDRVIIANKAARRLLGAHVVGQDVRMALRKPEAVELLGGESEGTTIVHGLARRRDIWRINRKALDGDLAVFEFVNKTAEADIGRAHTDFVANASHELRTPLASIIGYVETLQEARGGLDTATAGKFLDTIQREAKRLQELVGDLMSLSRIEAEKHDVPTERVSLNALAERAARDGAGSDRIQRLDFAASGDFTMRGDLQQLEQMVRNLVDNAFKYGAPEGKVTVRLEPQGADRVAVTVRDEGEGISPEHLPHLTRRFYRTDPGRSRASGGTGLGLAIVKHIVERHRGRLTIDSAQGQGTTVTAMLPLP